MLDKELLDRIKTIEEDIDYITDDIADIWDTIYKLQEELNKIYNKEK